MPKKYENILFDLDGTLVDSAPDIVSCVKRSFAEALNRPEPPVRENLIGFQLKEILLGVDPTLSPGDIAGLTASFRKIYDDSGFPGTSLYPGASETLSLLKGAGARLYLVTNKPKKPTGGILSKFGLELFDGVVCPDSLPGIKMSKSGMIGYSLKEYALEKSLTAMVGDSEPDMLAAQENGIASIAALYGYGKREKLLELNPDHSLEDISALASLVISC